MKQISAITFLTFFALLISGCDSASLYLNSGYWKMSRGHLGDAKNDFVQSLLREPFQYKARYNLSMANIQLEQLKDALVELSALEELYENTEAENSAFQKQKAETLFRVYFAKAFVLGLVQDIDGALAVYQKALGINPDSKEVKHNIEVLMAEGKAGGKGKKGRKKKGDIGEGEGEAEVGEDDEDKEGKGAQDKDVKGQDEESLKKKNLSKEEIEQLLKEIKDQESKVRAKENKGKAKKGDPNGKTW